MTVTMLQPKPIVLGEITRAIDLGLRATDAEVDANYKLSYWNWDRKNWPEWKAVGPVTRGGDRLLRRETSSTPYIFVDLGTKGPYPIKAKNAPRLLFQTGFIPKTSPGRFTSQAGGSFGEWTSPLEVTHPGIKPRDFSKRNAEHAQGVIGRHMSVFMSRA